MSGPVVDLGFALHDMRAGSTIAATQVQLICDRLRLQHPDPDAFWDAVSDAVDIADELAQDRPDWMDT